MNLRRAFIVASLALFAALGFAQERVSDVVYAKHEGVALTMDVFKAAKPNGMGVIFVVSGGWVSSHDQLNALIAKPLNDRGVTVFEVVHGSQPRFKVNEIIFDIIRSIRFVRANAATYGVDQNKIGIYGASAGGHLSLLAAGLGDTGKADAKDPVDRVSSQVEAVAAFFPPTDFDNFGKPGQNAIDVPMLKVFWPAFGVTAQTPHADIEVLTKKLSPINYVTAKFPPTYIIQGDKDILVPKQQAELFIGALQKIGVPSTLIIVPNAGHDATLLFSTQMDKLADWFVRELSRG